MEQRFASGDFLFFQLEAGFALIRLLHIEEDGDETIWHLAAYNDLFPDTESIESAVLDPGSLSLAIPHVALTDRAFESTQLAQIGHSPLDAQEARRLEEWFDDKDATVSDRSIRLHMGLR